jgi:hypothetical protein
MVALAIVIDATYPPLLLTSNQLLELISTLPKLNEVPDNKPAAPLRKVRSVVLEDGRGVAGPECPPPSKMSWEFFPGA